MNYLDHLKRVHKDDLDVILYVWEYSYVGYSNSRKVERVIGYLKNGHLHEVYGSLYNPDHWIKVRPAVKADYNECYK